MHPTATSQETFEDKQFIISQWWEIKPTMMCTFRLGRWAWMNDLLEFFWSLSHRDFEMGELASHKPTYSDCETPNMFFRDTHHPWFRRMQCLLRNRVLNISETWSAIWIKRRNRTARSSKTLMPLHKLSENLVVIPSPNWPFGSGAIWFEIPSL